MTLRLNDRIEWLLPENMAEDSHGNVSYDWATAATVLEPAFIGTAENRASTTESTLGQDQITTLQLAILLPNTAGTAKARARWRGREYEVDGDVMPIVDLKGRTHHREAMLRRVSG